MRLGRDVQIVTGFLASAYALILVLLASGDCTNLRPEVVVLLTDTPAHLFIYPRPSTATWRTGIHVQATVAFAPSFRNQPLLEPSAWMIPRCLSPDDSSLRM
jgi:hypothetical protein